MCMYCFEQSLSLTIRYMGTIYNNFYKTHVSQHVSFSSVKFIKFPMSRYKRMIMAILTNLFTVAKHFGKKLFISSQNNIKYPMIYPRVYQVLMAAKNLNNIKSKSRIGTLLKDSMMRIRIWLWFNTIARCMFLPVLDANLFAHFLLFELRGWFWLPIAKYGKQVKFKILPFEIDTAKLWNLNFHKEHGFKDS